MKYIFLILFTASLSSAGTFFYMTQKMAPGFYYSFIEKAQAWVDYAKDPPKNCGVSRDTASMNEDGVVDKADLAEMLKEAKRKQEEKTKILKEFEDSPY